MQIKNSVICYCPCCNKPLIRSVLIRPQDMELAKCSSCGAVFFPHHVWAQKAVEIGDEPPGAVYIDKPSVEDYRKALEQGLAKNEKEEKYLKCRGGFQPPEG